MSNAVRRRHAASSDLVTAYLDEIAAYPLLTRDEEVELARRARAGDRAALELLICSNLRFVVSIAKKYQTRGVPLIDLINEGNVGLMQAAEKFDETKGVKFISYAVWWVRQMIFQALAEQSHAVRVPVSRAGTLLRLGRQAEELRQDFGREPTREELAAATSMSDDDLAATLPLARPAVSLDAALGDGEEATLLDYLPAEDTTPPDRGVVEAALADSVVEALADLSPRESHIIRRYFGFDGADQTTLEVIGAEMGITRERARQIKERALRKLRKSVHSDALAGFHE